MTKKTILCVSVTILICAVGWAVAVPSPPEHERAKLQVLKVFSARDGDAVFREYMVNWKGQEVVVKDSLILTDYHVGDTACVLVMRNKYPDGGIGPDLLSFEVVPAAHLGSCGTR